MNHTGTGKYELLLARCEGLEPIRTAVAHPCDASSLSAAVDAAAKGLIIPILVGPVSRIRESADKAQIDLGTIEIVDAGTAMRLPRSRCSWCAKARRNC
jgi:phosphotransacetylase